MNQNKIDKLLKGKKVRYKAIHSGKVYDSKEDAIKDNSRYLNDVEYRYRVKEDLVKKPNEYNIPFNDSKKITLTNAGLASGAVLSTNMLDTIAKHAEAAGLPIKTALGLAVKESTLGNPTDDTSVYKILSPDMENIFRKLGTGLNINQGNDVNPRDLINWYKDEFGPYREIMEYLRKKNYDKNTYKSALEKSEKYDDNRISKYENNYGNNETRRYITISTKR